MYTRPPTMEPPSSSTSSAARAVGEEDLVPASQEENSQRPEPPAGEMIPRTACVICFQDDKAILLEPCMHVCVCVACSGRIHKCPLCVRPIVRRRRVFI